jgi:hypothetical protein
LALLVPRNAVCHSIDSGVMLQQSLWADPSDCQYFYPDGVKVQRMFFVSLLSLLGITVSCLLYVSVMMNDEWC